MRTCYLYLVLLVAFLAFSPVLMTGGSKQKENQAEFHTSDRCLACHNQLATAGGEDVSIGLNWRASIMANSARDPYWQASVRRETVDHPEATADIQDECSVCHMPIPRYQAKLQGKKGQIFPFLPFNAHPKSSPVAEDGVTCSVCHQISKEKLGTRESFNGGFVIEPPSGDSNHAEYGPFNIAPGNQRIMNTSTAGFRPMQAQHIRDSALCGTCHQLYTTARGAGGKEIGTLPEQMPYLEWLHSDYPAKASCQNCHMPEVREPVPISSVLGAPRSGLHRHVFVGGNFLMPGILNRYRDDLSVVAQPSELTAASAGTLAFLQSQSARVTIRVADLVADRLNADVLVQNLGGHKLPTAYPSRRAWLHVTVRNRMGNIVFESGALNPDGSIQGNDNDDDKTRYEPYYREITSADQVEIFESILKDSENRVTTGLLSAVGYLKDDRVLPSGFDKASAEKDIQVVGGAAEDPNFTGSGALVRYSVPVTSAEGPFRVEAELWYQPIAFRWAHNLETYSAAETRRFVSYYNSASSNTATILAKAEAVR